MSAGTNEKAMADAKAIAALALAILLENLAHHGNQIGKRHRAALGGLVMALACQITRARVGRMAYPLPCGAGKTQALIALLVAVHRLGLRYSVVIAAQKVSDLAKIRRDLRCAGVPTEMVGLIHSKGATSVHNDLADATPAVLLEDCTSTGTADRPFLLATHEMLRQGGRGGLAFTHRGQPRDLMVWDETLLLSEVGAIAVREVENAAFHYRDEHPTAAGFLSGVANKAGAEMIQQRRGHAPTPFLIACEEVDRQDLDALARRGRRRGGHDRMMAETLRSVLQLVAQPVAVAIPGGNGKAIIHHETVIEPHADNIAVLDASHVVRLLARIGVTDAGTEDMRACKQYDACKATVYPFAASKSSQGDRASVRKLAALTARIISTLPADESIVIFTFKATRSMLEAELSAAGIDLANKLHGKLRIAIATWGTEAGTNQHAHCRHVILAGVLRQDRARLMAQWSGEHGDLTDHPDAAKLREVELSEMTSCVLQALSRGRSRVSVIGPDGESWALKQSIHIIDSDAKSIAEVLFNSGCLPGMRWVMGDIDKAHGLTAQAAKVVAAVLANLPAEVASISSIKLKRLALAAGAPSINPKAWTVAIKRACPDPVFADGPTWEPVGREVRRSAPRGIESLQLAGARPSCKTVGVPPKEDSLREHAHCFNCEQLTKEAA